MPRFLTIEVFKPAARSARTRQELNGRSGSTHHKHDLAFSVAGLQEAIGRLGFGERGRHDR